MNKYDNYYYEYNDAIRAEDVLVENEKILWKGKPNRTAFMINSALSPLTVFAILWLLVDGAFIWAIIASGEIKDVLFFIIPFFAIHLMPVWIWLGNILTAGKRWKNTEYAITDKRILIKTGFWGIDFKTIYYKDIKNVNLRKGIIDSSLGVGDLYFEVTLPYYIGNTGNTANSNYVMFDLENPYELYTKIQKTVLDIQTDIEFPNAYRPTENPGYTTNYKGPFEE